MQTTARRTIVDIDTRRRVFMIAKARKPADTAKVPHEAFIRNALKDALGWPRREPAPEQLKLVARQMAAQFVAADKARWDEQAAKDAAVAQGIADNV